MIFQLFRMGLYLCHRFIKNISLEMILTFLFNFSRKDYFGLGIKVDS